MTDLIDRCIGSHPTTGIQRVQECIVAGLIDKGCNVGFTIVDSVYNRVWLLNQSSVHDLVDVDAWQFENLSFRRKRMAETIENTAVEMHLNNNDVVVILGAFWRPVYGPRFYEYICQSGCKIIPFIYDVIPIDFPQLSEYETQVQFLDKLPGTIANAECIITISQYTKSRIEEFCRKKHLSIPLVNVLNLASGFQDQCEPKEQKTDFDIDDLSRPFVVCVGTFEPRKNYLRLANVWVKMSIIRESIPLLLIVGNIGWISAEDYAEILSLSHKSGAIKVMHGISDLVLQALYKKCLFTVFPSIVEGWGLPIGESIRAGKLCIASSGGATHEVSGNMARYFDPNCEYSMQAALEQILDDNGLLLSLEKNIFDHKNSRDWNDVVEELFGIVG